MSDEFFRMSDFEVGGVEPQHDSEIQLLVEVFEIIELSPRSEREKEPAGTNYDFIPV